MARSLAERLRAHEQHKAKLAAEATSLKNAERRARTRRLIGIGELVEKVGLLGLDTSALYGALLSLRDSATNKDQIDKWFALGQCAFAREARMRDTGKEAIVMTFPTPLARVVAAPLRAAGFRFNRVLHHWEGLAHYAEAEALATTHGGTARRVSTDVGGEPTAATAEAAE
jgi:hypothetical protein